MATSRNKYSTFSSFFLPIAFLIVGGTYLYGTAVEDRIIGRERARESSELDLSASELKGILQSIASDIQFLASLPQLKHQISQESDDTLSRLADTFLVFANAYGIYDQVRWIDASGMERLRVDYGGNGRDGRLMPDALLSDKSDRYYFRDSVHLPVGDVYISDFDLNIEHGLIETPLKPTLRIATPATGSNGERDGIVVINYRGRMLLESVARAAGTSRGRIMLLNREGYWLRGPTPADEWGFMYGRTDARLALKHPAAWREMSLSTRGQALLDDGLWTWERIFPVQELHVGMMGAGNTGSPRKAGVANAYTWVIANRLPRANLDAMMREIWWRLSVPVGILLLVAAAGAAMLTQSQHRIGALNERLMRRAKDAEAASRTKANFLANMSHEIRTPMNAVLGLAYLLEQRNLDGEDADLVHKIRISGEALLAIINDILDFSKIEAGRLEIEAVTFDLAEVLDKTAAIMTASAAEKDIELIVGAVPDGAAHLLGDPQRLSQVLINLTSNAIKFTDKGEVSLLLSAQWRPPDEVALTFTVRDTGIGIPLDKQADIFSSFSQADMSTTRRFGGTGLGLSISRHLVEAMGGRIDLSSTPGEGSEFRATVPFKVVHREDYQPPAMVLQSVLVVDDNDSARASMEAVARSLGWSATTAASGAEAVDLAVERARQGKPFDVLFMDWRMPGMDGLTASKTIRDRLGAKAAPVIIMVTAFSREDLMRHDDVDIADVVLTKPVTASTAFNAVAEAKASGENAGLPAQAAPQRHGRRLAGMSLLVVDDSDINRDVARRILEGEGATIVLAGDGAEAVAWLRANPQAIDAVLMDIQMPVMDGYDATRALRAMPATAALPVVALTAGAFKSQEQAALGAGMNGFISKPFKVDDMIAVLRGITGFTPPPEPRPEEKEDAAALPALDVAAGLNLWGEEDAYRDYLRRFMETYGETATVLEELLAGDRVKEAAELAHKVAGAAANMALAEVAARARRVMETLDGQDGGDQGGPSPANAQEIAAQVAALREALKTADAAILAFSDRAPAPPPATPPSRVDLAAAAPLLDALRTALDSDNPDTCAPILARLAEVLPADRLHPVTEAIARYDFRGAESLLAALCRSLGIALSTETS